MNTRLGVHIELEVTVKGTLGDGPFNGQRAFVSYTYCLFSLILLCDV